MEDSAQQIVVSCPACGKKYQLARTAIGKSAKCNCGNQFVVQLAAPKTAAPAPAAPTQVKRPPACVHHPNNRAVQRCVKCHNLLCDQCALRSKSGKYVCQGCIDKLRAAAKQPTPSVTPAPAPQSPANVPVAAVVAPDEEVFEAEVVDEPSELDGFDFDSLQAVPPARVNPYTHPSRPVAGTGIPGGLPAGQPVSSVGTGPAVITGRCEQHPASTVVHQCSICQQPVCRTCAFAFPPNIICCPKCASDTTLRISPHRKVMIYAALGCAIFATLSMALLCSGMLAVFDEVPFGGLMLEAAIILPLCLGAGMAFGSYNKAEGNPAMLWVGGIWNALGIVGWFAFLILITLSGFAEA